jgi:hypothetical protein
MLCVRPSHISLSPLPDRTEPSGRQGLHAIRFGLCGNAASGAPSGFDLALADGEHRLWIDISPNQSRVRVREKPA